MTYVVFDIGGSKTQVAVSDDLIFFSKVESFKTPAKFEEGIEKIIAAVNNLTDKKVTGISGGVRGRLMEDKSGIENDAVLTKWKDKSIVGALHKKFAAPVYLENDSAIYGLGEAVYGAGKGMDIVAYHTVGNSVGGAKIECGHIDSASVGFEPGHQILDVDRTVLGEGVTPTLENLVSGSAVKQRFGVESCEMPQSDVLWEDLAGYLAQGLRNTILYWSPDVIVLGGSMITGDPRIGIDSIRKYTVEALDGFVECPHVTISALGDEAGLYGAMAILKQQK